MKKKLLQSIVAVSTLLLFGSSPRSGSSPLQAQHLMPLPERLILNEGKLVIDGAFHSQMTGYSDRRLQRAVTRFFQRLQKRTGLPFAPTSAGAAKQGALRIHCNGAGERIQSIASDESYTLEVTDEGAGLAAPSPIGIIRGLETFLQLVDLDAQTFFVRCLKIEDRPRFRWRGILIDVCRHWEPVEVIERNLDEIAAVKLNVLHWHLSDDQGFRVESKTHPKLQQLGSDGNYYTQAEVREVVAYARDRGIRVVPEFDMPGHTTAWLAAYPELASAPGPYQIERAWGVFDPCMDPTNNRLYSFLDQFIGEMAALFPDEYFHIGGDEVNGKQWNAGSRIRAFKKREGLKDNGDLQAYFSRRLQKILSKHGKKMIGWDEILHPGLPRNVVVQSWRSQAALAESARAGYSGILSYGYYLDHMQPASFHYSIDPLGKEAATLKEDEKSRVLGGEACMWGEFVNPDNIDSRIWPRTAAIAERLWSPAGVTDVNDMYRRLQYVNRDLCYSGLMHRNDNFEMLQRMSGDRDPAPLLEFAALLKPVGLGTRRRTRPYTSLTPLNRMADAVLPESDTARSLQILVERFLSSPADSNDASVEIKKFLSRWIENEKDLKPVLEGSCLLREALPVSDMITELCRRALQALERIQAKQSPSEEWRRSTADLVAAAEEPQAEMLIAITPAIKKLIEAVPGSEDASVHD
jgi:hexosaminidase